MQAVIKRETYLGYLVGVMNNKGSITIFSFQHKSAEDVLGILCTASLFNSEMI